MTASRIIIQKRAEKHIDAILNGLNGASTKEEVAKIVDQNWIDVEMAGVGEKEKVKYESEIDDGNFLGKVFPV